MSKIIVIIDFKCSVQNRWFCALEYYLSHMIYVINTRVTNRRKTFFFLFKLKWNHENLHIFSTIFEWNHFQCITLFNAIIEMYSVTQTQWMKDAKQSIMSCKQTRSIFSVGFFVHFLFCCLFENRIAFKMPFYGNNLYVCVP